MGLAPKSKKLTFDIDDSLEPKDLVRSVLEQLQRQMGSFMGDVHAALDGGITGANLQRQTQKLDVTTDGSGAPTSTVQFDCTLPTRPSIVYVAQVRVLSGSAPSAAVDTSHWTLVGTGKTIQFQSLPGLAASSRYEITVFVE